MALDRLLLSSSLGYLSILAWVFAQAPQLYENHSRGSVEGLAFSFLASWCCADTMNLLGCILTHQLPFQTYLATYFVIIDIGLISQYIYYSRKHPIPVIPPLTADGRRQSHLRSSRSDTWLAGRARSRKRRPKHGDHRRHTTHEQDGYTSEDPLAQSWMSESSAAQTPAAHSPAAPRSPVSTHPASLPSHPHSHPHSRTNSVPSATSLAYATSPSGSDHLDSSEERGRSLTRVAAPRTGVFAHLETISGSPASGSPARDFAAAMRAGFGAHGDETTVAHPHHHNYIADPRRNTSSTSRSRPPVARRATSMVFLSVGLLVTIGKWGSTGSSPGEASHSVGKAWGNLPRGLAGTETAAWPIVRHPVMVQHLVEEPSTARWVRRQMDTTTTPVASLENDKPNSPPKHEGEGGHGGGYPKRDLERFIGRAAAWLCTSLYLTSRLPQIWQNFRRRSVEGLSMLLFVMAFVGNSLYVSSILSHPNVMAPGYLLESLPYLLGSGGTLCFDITIVTQSYLYSEKRKARKSAHHTMDTEEAAALLGDGGEDEQDVDGRSYGGHRGRHSRSRSASGGMERVGSRSISSRRPISRQRSDSTQLTTRSTATPQSNTKGTNTPDSIDAEPTPFFTSLEAEEDHPFRFERSLNRVLGPTRSRTNTTGFGAKDDVGIAAISEEGESSVTIRA